MATRSQIGFYRRKPELNELKTELKALVYRHWDGYPDGVIPDILPILSRFAKERGLSDTEYASAYLVYMLKRNGEDDYGKLPGDDMLNIGISDDFHGDIEYFYAVYPTAIDVYECPFDADPFEYHYINTVSIDNVKGAGNIQCVLCSEWFEGVEGKEDTCPDCIRNIVGNAGDKKGGDRV